MDNERTLLVGLVAVQENLVAPARVCDAYRDWVSRGGSSLTDILVERGWLDAGDRVRLEQAVARSLAANGGDARASLAQVDMPVWESVARASDSSLDHSIASMLLPPARDAATQLNKIRDLFVPAMAPPGPQGAERYQRLARHAAGGLGQVWRARDNQIGRVVALKELKPETADHPELQARFVEEARITGQLEHPGIVPVYELVQEADGRPPCYVMRLISGRTLSAAIADYHREANQGRGDPIRRTSLVQAFLAVCQTLAYAHAQGVIHRDLKGLNVILGDYGEVIVLDWGLAKRLGAAEDLGRLPLSSGSGLTQAGQVLGTPAYMAPEQAAGKLDAMDARTDVYGLGAILYEILTGRPPFSLADVRLQSPDATVRDSAMQELLRRVVEEAPAAPRTLADAPRPLEAVCLKALAKAPADRYPSAHELAQDVQRWLADEPVRAFGEPWWQRLARWGRRHRAFAASLAALLLAAVVGLSISTVLISREQARTHEAALRATENFRKAREVVDDFFVTVSEKHLLNVPGMQPAREELLRKASAYYENFVDTHRGDADVEADLARTLYRLARVSSDLGDGGKALAFATQAAQRFAELAQRHPAEWNFRLFQGKALSRQGMTLYRHFKENGRAQVAYEQAKDILAALHRTHPDDRNTAEALAVCLGDLGNLHRDAGDARKAAALFQGALELLESLRPRDPDNAEILDSIAAAHTSVGNLFWLDKRLPEARKHYAESLRIHQDLVRAHPKVIHFQMHLARSHNSLANASLGKPEALDHYRQAITIRDRLAECNPDVPEFRAEAGNAHLNLGLHFYRDCSAARARKDERAFADSFLAAKESLAHASRLLGELADQFPGNADYAGSAGAALAATGDLYFEKAPAQGVPWYEKSRPWLEKAIAGGRRDGLVLNYLRNACWGPATLETEARRWKEALPLWKRALEIMPPGESLLAEWEAALAAADKDGFFKSALGRAVLADLRSVAAARDSALLRDIIDRVGKK